MPERRAVQSGGFETVPRVAAACLAVSLLAVGVLAVFKSHGDIATAAIIVVGGILGYVALSNDRIGEVTTSGLKMMQRESTELVEQVIARAPGVPDDVHRFVAEWLERGVRDLPVEVQRDVRETTDLTKSELLTDLCKVLGREPLPIRRGSTIPVDVFRDAAAFVGVSADGSMPKVAQRIAESAGMTWDARDWSRGSTVTASGLRKVLEAVRAHKTAGGSTAK